MPKVAQKKKTRTPEPTTPVVEAPASETRATIPPKTAPSAAVPAASAPTMPPPSAVRFEVKSRPHSAAWLLFEILSPFENSPHYIMQGAIGALADELEVLASSLAFDEGLVEPRTFCNVVSGYVRRLRVIGELVSRGVEVTS